MKRYAIHTNDLDAIRDMLIRQVETMLHTIDRVPLEPRFRQALRDKVSGFQHHIDEVTAKERQLRLLARRITR